jgi:DNA-binding transcriptional MerR regulator
MMTIQEFARLTGLTVHTLRYYEQIGLLDNIRRASSGHRVYDQHDQLWVAFIKRLKATGMPLREIQRYAVLRKQGESSLSERKQLLEHHAAILQQQLAEQQAHLGALMQKIAHYDHELAKQCLP